MKAVLVHLGLWLAAAGCVAAQSATLRSVNVVRADGSVQINVSLSDRVQPSIFTTTGPDRLVLDFPNTSVSVKQRRIKINRYGVREVRFGLNTSDPPTTRMVIDLDSDHAYQLHSNGTTISLTVEQPAVAAARKRHQGAPAAASGGTLIDIFRRHPQRSASVPDSEPPAPPPAPPAEEANATGPSAPSAAHPDRGSLQEGTVTPGFGPQGSAAATSSATAAPPVHSGGSASAEAAKDSGKVPSLSAAAAPQSGPEVQIASGTGGPAAATSHSEAAQAAAPASSAIQPGAPATASSQPTTTAVKPAQTAPSTPAGSSSGQEWPAQTQGASAQPGSAASTDQNAPAVPPSPRPADGGAVAATPPPSPAETAAETDHSGLELLALDPSLRTVFKVKYVADGVAYLDGGKGAGLAEGMKLEIKDTDLPVKQGATVNPNDPRITAELEVTAVAETSAVTTIHAPKRPVKEGDLAYLSSSSAQTLIQQRTLGPTRQYPVVIAFTQGDALDEEVRKQLPRPPQPSVNRVRGRVGFDYMGTVSHGNPSSTNSDVGMVMRADITRIAGTHWNLSGYWRGRLRSRSATDQATLQDLINRTYHLGLFYDNPDSRWVAGVGRLYLPWAASLDTIDGGYFGAKLGGGATAGFFAGSTPDPTSWSYNPDRRLAGAFINFEGGDYDHVHYSTTSGMGISALKWQIDRPFVFFENTLSYKRYLSIYDSLQADSPRGNPAVAAPGAGLSRNFLTVRLQVHPRVELDFNHNYLRDVPTYDPALVGTGLLDKYLFQGASVGARIEVLKQVFIYTNLGRNNRSGDAKQSLNQLYGLTFAHLPWWGLRADAHYSRFSSSFADGFYRSFSLGRNMTDDLRMEVLVGDQTYTSTLAANDRTRFLNANTEFSLGPRYFMQGGFTFNRGQTQNYDQWLFTFGYRFDNRVRHKP